jgi:hypothetical protein
MKLLNAGEQTKPGNWYFFVVCRNPKCQQNIIFAEAPSLEEENQPKVRGGRFACPHCNTAGTYRAHEVRRGQVDDSP